MSRIFFRTISLLLILNFILIGFMMLLGSFREAGAILVAYENDNNQRYMRLVLTDTGAMFRHKRIGFSNLSADACRYVTFQVDTEGNQAQIDVFNILGTAINQYFIPDYTNTWRSFWSNDSEYLALLNIELASGAVLLTILQVETGETWQVVDKSILLDSLFVWSPNSRYIAFTAYSETNNQSDMSVDFESKPDAVELLEQHILIYDIKHEHLIEIQAEGLDTMSQMLWSNDERHLLVMSGTSSAKLGIIDLENERMIPIEGLQAMRHAATWSPDNQLLVAGGDDSLLEKADEAKLYLVDADTGAYRAIQAVPFGIEFGAWSSNGQTLLYFDIQERSIRLLNIGDYSQWRLLIRAGEAISYWTEDNRFFSTRVSGGYLWFIEPEMGETYATGQRVTQLFDWLNNEQLVYTTRDREAHFARFRNGHFEILARYPLREIRGVCMMNHSEENNI